MKHAISAMLFMLPLATLGQSVPDVSGVWVVSADLGTFEFEITCTFKQAGTALTGSTCSSPMGGNSKAGGAVDGPNVKFT